MKKKRKYVPPSLRCYPMESQLMDQPFGASLNDLPDYKRGNAWDSADGSGLFDYVKGKSWNSAGSDINYNSPPGGNGWESWYEGEDGN